jgi:hypothetical protein
LCLIYSFSSIELQLDNHVPSDNTLLHASTTRSSLHDNNSVQSYCSCISGLDNDVPISWAPPRIFSENVPNGALKPNHINISGNQRASTSTAVQQSAGLSDLEYQILQKKGAFILPPKWVCKELIEAYFAWVAPILPIINRVEFMRGFAEEQPPSYLLMQSVLLAGCRVCKHPYVRDDDGSTRSTSKAIYRRAKALYDANHETDRLAIVQALTLLGWYWDGPECMCPRFIYLA